MAMAAFYAGDQSVLAVTAWQDAAPGPLDEVRRVEWFWGGACWGMWRDRWDHVKDNWPPSGGGYDGYLWGVCQSQHQVTIQPLATRCKNIGEFGVEHRRAKRRSAKCGTPSSSPPASPRKTTTGNWPASGTRSGSASDEARRRVHHQQPAAVRGADPASWERVRGIGKALLVFSCEPHLPAIELCPLGDVRGNRGHRQRAARSATKSNPYLALAAGFATLDADFVIQGEEDVLGHVRHAGILRLGTGPLRRRRDVS